MARSKAGRERALRNSKVLNYALSVVVLVLAVALLDKFGAFSLFSPSYGNTITGIDTPLAPSSLSIINYAPDSYFETAGERLLNGTLTDQVMLSPPGAYANYTSFDINGRPSVIYIGAISCLWCGENRWAMALALSRFGNFTSLYNGYSSIGDADLPTLYWKVLNYSVNGTSYGNSYSSRYINFISAEYESPITAGFELPRAGIGYFVAGAPNASYSAALGFMNGTNKFQGTPFTFWGNVLVPGADGVVFGNSTPSSASLPLTYMTHSQVLSQLQSFNDQFSWGEYASADVYISYLCPSIGNAAPACSLPAIRAIEQKEGFA